MFARFRLALLLALGTAACDWVSLAAHALTYRELSRGEPGNLAASDSLIYATLAQDGVAIIATGSSRRVAVIAPPPGSQSVDDLAIADGLLFVLDARPPGFVSVYALDDPVRPRLVSPPRAVQVGPFSGITAAAGVCIVSGGTSELTAWRYDHRGIASQPSATADLGRGQPDALLSADGRDVYVSTHYWGPYFGIDVVAVDGAGRLRARAELAITGAGFTTGGAKPANFPVEAALFGRDTLLVAHAGGLAVIDVAAPGAPVLRATISVDGPAVNVDALGNDVLVAVAGDHPALVLLRLMAGTATVARRTPLPPGTIPAGVALTATHAAVAARDRVELFTR